MCWRSETEFLKLSGHRLSARPRVLNELITGEKAKRENQHETN